MNRRKFIKTAIASGVIIGVSGGVTWMSIEKNKQPLTIEVALAKLELLAKDNGNNILTNGQWNLYQIFTHCAQSVEFSMLGFPEHKSKLFKNTVGRIAFSLFSSKGKMTHNLSEVIPGAEEFSAKEDIMLALDRFKKSLVDFNKHQGVLAPHFAYGNLSKTEYEIAHVMHFYNHLQEIELKNQTAT